MPSEIAATARRTSLVSTYGVGSLLPAQEDSVMICSIDDWPLGEELIEPRLAQSLGVQTFRSPATRRKNGDVPAVRFPVWAFCPECRTLGPWWDIAQQVGSGKRLCKSCSVSVSPSRFVCCCSRGHIEDFPYRAWCHEDPRVSANGHRLRLIAQGRTSALSDLIVSCSCGAKRSLEGAFEANALRGIRRCSGSRPWLLEAGAVTCDEALRTLQRGSSNVWFAAVRSAISIPSVKARARHFAEWKFRDAKPDASASDLASMFKPPPGCSVEDVAAAIEEMRNPAATPVRLSESELRAQEYRALVNGLEEENDDGNSSAGKQFLCTELDFDGSELPDLVAQVSRVSRLREVRALYGFSRITPATSEDAVVPVSSSASTWLPAIEVMGEGIFLRFDETLLQSFLESDYARQRHALLVDSHHLAAGDRAGEIDPRLVTLHSLAHILLNELSLTAGYPAASLRERVYAESGQSGILVYTATADSAGSLGGLASLSEPNRLSAVLASAISRASWCTSDPVCIETPSSGVDGQNLAACHACLLLPETSCEHFNVMLDRALLVGEPGGPDDGLFSLAFS